MTTRTHPAELSDQSLRALQNLIQINVDSAEGFRTAAKTVNDVRLASLFTDIGQVREQFAQELSALVPQDTRPAESGSLAGAAHRWWLQLRGSLTDENAYAVLAEAERGEDHIKHQYEQFLEHCVEPDVRSVLQQQYVQVKAGHDRVRDLRDAYKRAD